MWQRGVAVVVLGMFMYAACVGETPQQPQTVPTPPPMPQPGLGVDVKKVMTADEFKNCGLAKLSPLELTNLSAWLGRYTVLVIQAVQGGATPAVIESRIDGEFEGWDGETIFKLENGQIWQQASYSYRYHYAYRPKVIIFKTGTRYKMKVEGIEDTIYVQRLK